MTEKHWTWDQSAGLMLDPNGKRFAGGYSGRGEGLNNSAMQHVVATGPIPQGMWIIGALEPKSKRTGRNISRLEPMPGTNTFGRSAFQIHGDNGKGNRTASSGCIIIAPQQRIPMINSPINLLKVVA
jgi:hypothetical protein